ncbi:MAG: helix-turn-helix domain-containing protein [Actinomycetota bacterium]
MNTHGIHPICCVAADGIQALDLVGPHEVFAAANQTADALGVSGRRYRLSIVSAAVTDTTGVVKTESPLGLIGGPLPPAETITGTLLLPGGLGARTGDNADLIEWLRVAGRHADRVATVCTGAYLAAAAGLLDEKRATTHWAWADQFAEQHPTISVEPDAIWVRDDPVWSSAGVTSGIDLALAMVEADLGADVAQTVARWFVVFLRRPGGQSQFSSPVWSEPAETEPVRAAQDAIHQNPAGDLRLDTLAIHAGLSSRHLARRFEAEIGMTPARYVETVRLEAAQRMLEETSSGVDVVATASGHGSAESLRRSFQRRLGISPTDYRRRFRPHVS